MSVSNDRYIGFLADAYRKGYDKRYSGLTDDSKPDFELFHFKNKDDLPRVRMVLGYMQSLYAQGMCGSLLDVGTGRGAFVFPLLRDFGNSIDVTCLDLRTDRIEMLQCVQDGGIDNIHPMLADICSFDAADKSFDVITLLEVLEHITDTESAVRNSMRLARHALLVSVPSKPDDNPEHVHLFSKKDLNDMFMDNGAAKVVLSETAKEHVAFVQMKRQ